MVPCAFYDPKSLIDDLPGRKGVYRHCEEEGKDHEKFSNRDGDSLDRGHDHRVYLPVLDVFGQEKVASHAHEEVADDLGGMDPEQHFVDSPADGIAQVLYQGECQLMGHITKN